MNPQDLNRYSYCNNNPLKYVDPSGHAVAAAWVIAVPGIGWLLGGLVVVGTIGYAIYEVATSDGGSGGMPSPTCDTGGAGSVPYGYTGNLPHPIYVGDSPYPIWDTNVAPFPTTEQAQIQLWSIGQSATVPPGGQNPFDEFLNELMMKYLEHEIDMHAYREFKHLYELNQKTDYLSNDTSSLGTVGAGVGGTNPAHPGQVRVNGVWVSRNSHEGKAYIESKNGKKK